LFTAALASLAKLLQRGKKKKREETSIRKATPEGGFICLYRCPGFSQHWGKC